MTTRSGSAKQNEAAAPPLTFSRARAGYGAAPPASRVLRIALRATALRPPLTPETSAAPGQATRGQAKSLPRQTARATPQTGGISRSQVSTVSGDCHPS
jgi:hypothetical protein